MASRSIIGKKTHRYGNDREKVRRVPFGLGAAPGTPGAAEKCLRCSFGNIPVIEEVVWTIPLPLTVEEATSTPVSRGAALSLSLPEALP